MRPLAVTNMERASHLPNVPTLRELGLKDFDVTNWYGIVAPAATSKEIIFKLNAELNRIMQQDAKSRLDELGIRLNPVTPEKFTEYLQTEIAKYQKVAKETGIRMD
jgi:tripartite-type tricarboxylate transporter receptor subunit TctC